MTKPVIRAVVLLLGASALQAQSNPRPPLFTRTDVYWGAAFLLGSIALSTADVQIARKSTDSSIHSTTLDKYARNFARVQEGTLTIGNLALWGIARLAKAPNMADITFHAAESVVIGSIACQVIRGPLGRSRPFLTNYSDPYDFHPFRGFTNIKYRAFPSIHTSSSFAVATVYTLETKRRAPGATWIVGPITYALAAGPGLARLYNGQHWASDLLAGAFVGVLAGGKVVRYNHEVNPRNAINRLFLGDNGIRVSFTADGPTVVGSWTF
ncbi:MAG TPA: phosphatase PAP2 family protein [Gemmatimonadaceae bacterium]|nr:phosphatase PAP2 family protein [Gemmatimonadaceae bacterium]